METLIFKKEYERQGLTLKEYAAIHWHFNSNYPKSGNCTHCGKTGVKRTEYALIKGRKYSNKINDYIELCVSCHRKYDMTEVVRANISTRMKNGLNSGKYKSNLPTSQYGNKNPTARPVLKINKANNEVLKEYDTSTSASIDVSGKFTGAINNCLRGRAKTAYGFKWRYKNE